MDEGLAVAESTGDAVQMIAAYSEKTSVSYFQGRFRAALEFADRAIALYDSERHHDALVALVGDDAGVPARSTSAWALFQLGYPDRALARSEEAIRLAVALDHPFSIAQARMWQVALHMERGDDVLEEQAAQVLRFSEMQMFPWWQALGKMMFGYAVADPALLLEGSALAAATGTQADVPRLFFLMLADAYRRCGLSAHAPATIDVGLATAAATSQTFYDARAMCLESGGPPRRRRRFHSRRVGELPRSACAALSRSPAARRRRSSSYARPPAWPGCSAPRTGVRRRETSSVRSTAGSPKASTRAHCSRRRRCSTSWALAPARDPLAARRRRTGGIAMSIADQITERDVQVAFTFASIGYLAEGEPIECQQEAMRTALQAPDLPTEGKWQIGLGPGSAIPTSGTSPLVRTRRGRQLRRS